jgi:hypothetical protein
MLISGIEILSPEVTMNTTIPAELLTLKKRFDEMIDDDDDDDDSRSNLTAAGHFLQFLRAP